MAETKTQTTMKEVLEAVGCSEDLRDRSRYVALKVPGSNKKLFLGKRGAIRWGRVASKSISLEFRGYKGIFGAMQLALKIKQGKIPRN